MNNVSLVVTIIGTDRPGLVESVAQAVAAHGGNWIESRMAHLAGKFAGILRVEVDQPAAAGLTAALRTLAEQGLDLIIHPDDAVAHQTDPDTGCVQLELVGQDRPGIVNEIAGVLAKHSVNVEELETRTVQAPNTGQTLFEATARLRLPPGGSEDALRNELERLAGDLMVDIVLGGSRHTS